MNKLFVLTAIELVLMSGMFGLFIVACLELAGRLLS